MQSAYRRLPKLVRFVLRNAAIGILLGWAVAAIIVALDIGGFGTRIGNAEQPYLAVLLLAAGFGVTFGFAYMATAVWLLPTDQTGFDETFRD
ncbi:hypothetical protein [Mangrovicella endophytica]|uniref:hypothetical protein n=1 Tax=Mangrovicella endophytica TaxID=2066697 RepID=UPI000C9DF77F|nr:hypothetical protein [Mangrovicella endophytica]